MSNIYVDDNGSYYSADKPKSVSHSMKPFVSDNLRDLLNPEPMTPELIENNMTKMNNALDTLNSMGVDKESKEAQAIIYKEMGLELPAAAEGSLHLSTENNTETDNNKDNNTLPADTSTHVDPLV